ncbi:MAG TPA: hypothetical protein PKN24_03265 [bacterium]|nr:hypothetical protein [bacterium]
MFKRWHWLFLASLVWLHGLGCRAEKNPEQAEWRLELIWETARELATPESVFPDTLRDAIYVANINGNPGEKDGNGFISRLTADGRIDSLHWVTGLNAPKGMAMLGDTLYVADIDQLVVIDIPAAKIVARHPAQEAKFLNDVAVTAQGTVVVSDYSANSAIYQLQPQGLELWLQGDSLNRPNGLYRSGDRLIVGNSGEGCLRAWRESNPTLEKLACPEHAIDGIAGDVHGNLYFSNWAGKIEVLNRTGEIALLLDTSAEKVQAADISIWPQKDLLLVPTFSDHRVMAYRIHYGD